MKFLHEDDFGSALVEPQIFQNRNVITASEFLRSES
jgi:hypothetical protein